MLFVIIFLLLFIFIAISLSFKSSVVFFSAMYYWTFSITLLISLPLLLFLNPYCFLFFGFAVLLLIRGRRFYRHDDNQKRAIASVLRIFSLTLSLILLIIYLAFMNTIEAKYINPHLLYAILIPILGITVAWYMHAMSINNIIKTIIILVSFSLLLIVWAVDPLLKKKYEYFGKKIEYTQPIFNSSFLKVMQLFGEYPAPMIVSTKQINTGESLLNVTFDYKQTKDIKLKNRLELIVQKDKYYNQRYKKLDNSSVAKIDTILKYNYYLFTEHKER